ncbi:MAG: TonB-dependent receptor [Acidobacteriales bacterium]|nr:TonB-dependent receptor [Terriglobales bacterium]
MRENPFKPTTRRRPAGRVSGFVLCVALCAFAHLSGPSEAYGQVLYGSLTGSITDPSEAGVPDATVQVTNLGTGVIKETTTNVNGIYLFADLQPGLYNVTLKARAFGTVTSEGLSIEANRVRRFDATLKVAQVTESVIVAAGAEALQTDRSDVNVNVTSRQITNLTLGGSMGRNYQSLMTIVPGAVMYGEQNSDAGNPQRSISVNVNGVSRLQNNTKLDGTSIVYPWLPTNTAYVPSTEAIETVNIVTNSYNAEQGMAGGAAVNLTIKSGTNDFHGTAWIFNIDSKFKARNFFQTTPQNPKNIINQFGLNFGGPLRIPKVLDLRNKLFFFVNWERTTRRATAPPRFFSVAPQDIRDGNFAATGTAIYDPNSATDPTKRLPLADNRIPSTRFDPAAVELMKRLPQPTLSSAGYVNNFVTSGSSPFNRDNVDIKVNHVVSAKLSYFGRYSISPHNIYDPPAFGDAVGDASMGGQLGYALGRTQIAGAGLTYTFSPTLLFDANFGYTRQKLGAQGPDLGTNYGLDLLKIPGTNGSSTMQSGMPAFQFASTWSNIGNANTGSPFLFRDNQYVANANLSWIKRTHTFRFGLDYWNQQINHFQPQGGTFQTARGTFDFNGNPTALQNGAPANRFNSWASFLLGLPSRAGKVEQLRDPNSIHIPIIAWYAQDQWQATRKLTVNLGVRWEYYPFPTRDWGGVSRFDPSDGLVYIGGAGSTAVDTGVDNGKGQLVPRIGLAYRLNNKTVIRTGYGMSVDPRTFINFRDAFPINFAWEIPQPTFNGVTNAFIPVTTLRLGLQPELYRQPVDLTQGTIKLQGGTGTNTVPEHAMRKYIQSWNFMLQRELPSGFVAQAGYAGTRATGQMANVALNAGAPGTGNAGRALYPQFGLTADINIIEPYKTVTYDALQTQLTKRWSMSQAGVVYTFSKAINYADNDTNPRIQWMPAANLNRGPAQYDRTHNFQSYWVLEAPFGKGHGWATSGVPSKLLGGWQLSGLLSAMSGWPITITQNNGLNLNAASSGQVPDQVKASVEILGGIGRGRPWFDPTAFAPVNIPAGQTQRFGNAGRNNVRGPAFFNTDLSLSRTFDIKERVHLQFRAEALNVFNHPNFALGLQWDGNTNVSDLSQFGIINYTVGANGASGNSGKGTGERQLRFGFRVHF